MGCTDPFEQIAQSLHEQFSHVGLCCQAKHNVYWTLMLFVFKYSAMTVIGNLAVIFSRHRTERLLNPIVTIRADRFTTDGPADDG